ncbi:MAG: integrase [endosymbiont of Galathealinum brachiosum]|uniref:Integrase n=1 Tax=endosymbiont of Galathealinum brachiosum TaxID=2200906 RepID=A0A370DEF7_9GAMM|nr:MAG: integrase [endosymbiont of Galathealinum brachiosum]
MALTETKLKNLKPRVKSYQMSDGNGLFIEVMSGGKKVWRLRYRLNGVQEKVTLGEYPAYTLLEARQWREECRGMVAKGISPMKEKQKSKGFLSGQISVIEFCDVWVSEVVNKTTKEPKNIRRVLDKDVIPAIGRKKLPEVSISDVQSIIDAIKARGSDQVALLTRNVMKRLFAYAISREKCNFNPAAAIEGRYIAKTKNRDVVLTPKEIGKLLKVIYMSSMKRSNKLALHLLILCMVRKSELLEATWDEIDFKKCVWCIPARRMKKDKPHVVYLSNQALNILTELKSLSSNSSYVLPSRTTLNRPISKTTLNAAIKSLDLQISAFVIHDFRRTASTHLHEAGFNSDWIEKSLAHEQGGVRGVYNRAEYSEQRQKMLQWWANFVDDQIVDRDNVILGRFSNV